ncbi:Luc7 protein [Saccharomycopsis crataegensis]|uniref:Luc7 protein n=1 Tax=Saccharomycopsis crataegensis TaxID=43959 RepID=A0AAV5QM33_9ASCO|nr:Luc7 protein [Saccharomycopsis crataegensis]
MAAEQRLVLEQLFGRDNLYNLPSQSSYRPSRSQPLNLFDNRICKSFLVGTCPHDLFSGTKEDMGRCKRIHLEKYKIQYESEKRNYEKRLEASGGKLSEDDKRIQRMVEEFEYDYMQDLEYHINEVAHKIVVAEDNLRHTPEEQQKIDKITKDLDNMDIRIGLVTQEVDLLTKKGQLVKALIESNKLNELLEQRNKFSKSVREITDKIGQANQQKLEVCSVCGAYLSRLDSDRRLADHFTGKIHLGYVTMRSELSVLRKKRAAITKK